MIFFDLIEFIHATREEKGIKRILSCNIQNSQHQKALHKVHHILSLSRKQYKNYRASKLL